MGVDNELWNEYRATWKEFARRLNDLQTSVDTEDKVRINAARVDVETARLAHNAARDRLAALLTVPQDEKRVRNTARLLWEFAGKPQGSAEDDWFRAERLVRSASACR